MKHVRRTSSIGRIGSVVVALVLSIASLATTVPRPAVAATSCRARNATRGTAAVTDLQAAIKTARPGDTIVVSGVCVGNFTIGKSLALRGQPTAAVPTPTLDGHQTGSVLRVNVYLGTVRIQGLTIQHGLAINGGGLYVARGDVVLNATTVKWNTAAGGGYWTSNNGGGIFVISDSLTLNTGTRVVHNTAAQHGAHTNYTYGGGIYTNGAPVTLNGNAIVASNHSDGEGGGIYGNESFIYLQGTSSVRGNSATDAGGGISSDVGDIWMRNASVVTSNRADVGGGIYGWDAVHLRGAASVTGNTATEDGGIAHTMWVSACDASSPDAWVGAISPNTPDNPPPVTYVTCT